MMCIFEGDGLFSDKINLAVTFLLNSYPSTKYFQKPHILSFFFYFLMYCIPASEICWIYL